jgi:ParB-like chromosome segregation protein Spo0J
MKNNPIIIDPEFSSLVPPMSVDSLAQLEQNIRAEGLRDNLTVWFDGKNRILLDGHHRWEILNKLLIFA